MHEITTTYQQFRFKCVGSKKITYKLAPYRYTTIKFIIGNINIKSARIITIIKSSSSLRCSRFNINATNGEFKICAAIKNFCRVKFCDETTITRGLPITSV